MRILLLPDYNLAVLEKDSIFLFISLLAEIQFEATILEIYQFWSTLYFCDLSSVGGEQKWRFEVRNCSHGGEFA